MRRLGRGRTVGGTEFEFPVWYLYGLHTFDGDLGFYRLRTVKMHTWTGPLAERQAEITRDYYLAGYWKEECKKGQYYQFEITTNPAFSFNE